MSPIKYFIVWGITHKGLSQKENITISKNKFDQQVIKFNYSVQIGKIIINDFQVYFDGENLNTPIMHMHAKLYSENMDDISFFELKKALVDMFGNSTNSSFCYDREDQNHFSIDNVGINFDLNYNYDYEYNYNSGHTSLFISNKRDYPHLLLNKEYEETVEIDEYLLFTNEVSINAEYKINARIKGSIPEVQKIFVRRCGIWVDHTNNKIGFGNRQYSMIFDKEEIKAIAIENILPTRGGGEANLSVMLDNGEEQQIFNGYVHTFDNTIKKIGSLTSKEVIIKPESYDC